MNPSCVFSGFSLVCKDMYAAEVVMCIAIVVNLLVLMEVVAAFDVKYIAGTFMVVICITAALLYLVFTMLGAV